MISVIIPVRNASSTLLDCLHAVLAQQVKDRQVIVVDDGSTDDSALLAAGLPVRVIRQSNGGPAAARNAGARAAEGDILAFTDADCVPAPTWLAELTRPFSDPEVVGVKGTYRTRQRSPVARFVQQEYEAKYARMERQEAIDFVDTYSAAYRREIFLQNDGFETALLCVEDQEFSFRLARKGYKMVFAPAAVVYHRHDASISEYLYRKFTIGYWKAFMLRWIPEKAFSDSHTLPSQRWQILLLAVTALFLAIALVWQTAFWFGLGTLGLFYASAGPFLFRVLREDGRILWLAPFLLLGRAAALGLGLAAGFLFPPPRARRSTGGLSFAARAVKRTMDIVGASLGLVLSAPILLLAAVAIKLDSPGPVLFVQERAGENGKPFRILKLRTMVAHAENQLQLVLQMDRSGSVVYKVPRDPRVTRVGAPLRRWSLDEVPQFWNVLRGEMSLVGPRPEETWLVALYNDRERQKLAFKPGLTGPMQVSGRGRLDREARLRLEMDYVRHYSVWKDLSILIRSIPAILSGDGAF